MPKLLVLFQSSSADVVHLAEVAAEGARSVRFAEVDVRRLPPSGDSDDAVRDATGRAHHLLHHVDAMGQYDGLIFAVGQEDGDALRRALDTFGGSLVNKVGAAVTPVIGTNRSTVLWSILGPMADREMILVPPPFARDGAEGDESTCRIGKRVAEVIGWVTHARSHHHH